MVDESGRVPLDSCCCCCCCCDDEAKPRSMIQYCCDDSSDATSSLIQFTVTTYWPNHTVIIIFYFFSLGEGKIVLSFVFYLGSEFCSSRRSSTPFHLYCSTPIIVLLLCCYLSSRSLAVSMLLSYMKTNMTFFIFYFIITSLTDMRHERILFSGDEESFAA